ncbi:hypothetical protein V2J09_022248 [Rumex salicifolius]
MAPPTQLVQHIESFVDSSSSSNQQAASVDAVASLLKNNSVTIEQLVKEMELYLTSTDNVLRARGILLLAEVLSCLDMKPLHNITMHSLITFFADRLTDWRALRGALVGSLVLLRRKSNLGVVTESDAKAVLNSLLQNLDVQSLGQHDRKLSFELLSCLLSRYPQSAAEVGDHLVYGFCEAIDGEKDPECLIIVFSIIEVLAALFPDPDGPIESFAEGIFEILGRYFPIHYTHPKSEDVAVSRDDLSKALMLALSSTPFFEPFAIPLLLEKLSTSLPLAKIDSIKYLACCTVQYGSERIRKHADSLWHALKATIFSVSQELALSSAGDLLDGQGFQENDIAKEALVLLERVGIELGSDFLKLILSDEDMKQSIENISTFRSYSDISIENKQKLLAFACIISTLVKTSKTFCNNVSETLFMHLVDNLQVPHEAAQVTATVTSSDTHSQRLNFGALYVCIEILSASRDLAVSWVEAKSKFHFENEPWCRVLLSFSNTLMKVFNFDLVVHRTEGYCDEAVPLIVKGLQILATFPGGFCTISKSIYEELLMTLISVIHIDFNVTSLWTLALKTLIQIGTSINQYNESGKSQCYTDIVVGRLISLMAMNDPTIPYPLILDAISDISTTGPLFLLKIVQGAEQMILAKLSEIYVDADSKLVFENHLSHFPVAVLDLIQKSWRHGAAFVQKDLLNATMAALKLAVAGCSDKDQHAIVQKAFNVMSMSESFTRMQLPSVLTPTMLEELQDMDNFDESLLSIFSSVIIAVRPQTSIPSSRTIILAFLSASLRGHVPSAQALGSIYNKMHQNTQMEDSSCLSMEDVLELIFKTILRKSDKNISLESCTLGEKIGLALDMADISLLQIHSVMVLSWLGKGLLMRGHSKVKDVLMIFMRCLLTGSELDNLLKNQDLLEKDVANQRFLMRSASDAFYILISDSEDCLNKKYHAISGPLYKQRLFSILIPILLSSIMKCPSSLTRYMLFRAFGHIVCGAPLIAIASESKKIVPVLLNAVFVLSEDVSNKDMVYNLLLVLSGLLMDKNGYFQEIWTSAYSILADEDESSELWLVRETAIQCLIAISTLPYTRIYPMRTQVLTSVTKALDDPKRAVRQEAGFNSIGKDLLLVTEGVIPPSVQFLFLS